LQTAVPAERNGIGSEDGAVPERAAATARVWPALRDAMYRLTWRSVMCKPDIQGSPAIAGGTLRPSDRAAHQTGHPSCRQAAIVVVVAHPLPPSKASASS